MHILKLYPTISSYLVYIYTDKAYFLCFYYKNIISVLEDHVTIAFKDQNTF